MAQELDADQYLGTSPAHPVPRSQPLQAPQACHGDTALSFTCTAGRDAFILHCLPIHALEALMNVYVEKHTEQGRCWVHMDDWRVGFRTAAEAERFVERLTSRLNAPHSRDMLADWSPHTGVTVGLGARNGAGAQSGLQNAEEA
ncbi:hypothetical protein CHN49_13790 [Pseudomonas putida]|nr:hypothetical protein CHN49_13790 [Pseudomonas putida]